jgi:hypothetical protein
MSGASGWRRARLLLNVTVFSPAESDAIEFGFMCEIKPAVTAAKIVTNRRAALDD